MPRAAAEKTNGEGTGEAPVAAVKSKPAIAKDALKLEAVGLVKQYGKRTVVRNVSYNVRQGEIVGILGPNGAGKTTSFYMTIGLVRQSGGQVFLGGEDLTRMPMYLRARRGMTRKQLALSADVSERHLANLEYGIGNVSMLVLLQVAGALRCSLAELIVSLCQLMKLTAVAEGVETALQLAFLRQAGCDQIQGYYFGRPQPADAFIADWQRAAAGRSRDTSDRYSPA